MKIIIDDREDEKRIDAIEEYFPQVCRVQRLERGDIIIQRGGDTPDIAIEVKTVNDFVNSIKNRRVQKEALQMKEAYPHSYIIIYGKYSKINNKYSKITKKQWWSNITSLTIRYHVPVFWVENINDFLIQIENIINTVDKETEPIEPPNVRTKNTNPFINVLIGIDNLGPKMARTLLNTFKTPGGVFKATDEELDNIKGLRKSVKKEIKRMR